MAAFLIGASKGSYFGFSDMEDDCDEEGLGGWAECAWKHYELYESVRSGQPLGQATVSGDGYRFLGVF